jgi:hypothetical protein
MKEEDIFAPPKNPSSRNLESSEDLKQDEIQLACYIRDAEEGRYSIRKSHERVKIVDMTMGPDGQEKEHVLFDGAEADYEAIRNRIPVLLPDRPPQSSKINPKESIDH